MSNNYTINLRLISDKDDLTPLYSMIKGYECEYKKKGESVRPGSSFEARANVLIVKSVHSSNQIDKDSEIIESKLRPLLKMLSAAPISAKREVYVSGAIYSDQFGFGLSQGIIELLALHHFGVSFSGISHSGSE